MVRPDRAATFEADAHIIAGNTIAYGATAGDIFIRGGVGERFAVRNSGARLVTEGVGDHGCEYMTGGRAVVLGRTGRNFAAGMSGGVAWVLDLKHHRVNTELVDLAPVTDEAAAELEELVRAHAEETGSTVAAALLEDWEDVADPVHRGDPARLPDRDGRQGEGRGRRAGRSEIATDDGGVHG